MNANGNWLFCFIVQLIRRKSFVRQINVQNYFTKIGFSTFISITGLFLNSIVKVPNDRPFDHLNH